jgi:hypothetical protein
MRLSTDRQDPAGRIKTQAGTHRLPDRARSAGIPQIPVPQLEIDHDS